MSHSSQIQSTTPTRARELADYLEPEEEHVVDALRNLAIQIESLKAENSTLDGWVTELKMKIKNLTVERDDARDHAELIATAAKHAGLDPSMPIIGYLRADTQGNPVWSEDCICQDPVYPVSEDDTGVSMPLVRQSDALKAIQIRDSAISTLRHELRALIAPCLLQVIPLLPGEEGQASDMGAVLQGLNASAPSHPDDHAVDRFATAMKAKLATARAKGRSGWDDPDQCTVEFLSHLLHGHIAKGDPGDVANFCMMLDQRKSGILPASSVAKGQGGEPRHLSLPGGVQSSPPAEQPEPIQAA